MGTGAVTNGWQISRPFRSAANAGSRLLMTRHC